MIAGQRYRPSLGRGFEQAKDKLHKIMREERRRAGLEDPEKDAPVLLAELQAAHLLVHEARIKPNTLKSYQAKDRNALKGLGNVPFRQLKRIDVEAWFARRAAEASTTTANRDLTRLNQIMSWAFDCEWIDRNPCRKIRKFREHKLKKFCLSYQQEARLKECSSPWLWGIIRFALLTGLRQREQLSLRWSQIEFGHVHLFDNETKGHKGRKIPLHPDCVAILEEQKERLGKRYRPDGLIWPNKRGKVIDRSTFRAWHWRKVFDMAGLEDQDWHRVTRHTFCSRLQRQGVDILEIAELAGHEDLRTARGYTHVAAENLRRAILSQK